MGRRIIAIVAALIVALVGAGAVVAYASSADARAVAGQQVRKVFIAKQAVPQGMSAQKAATQHLIVPAEVVAKGVPAGALTDVSSQKSSEVALATIPAGSVVLDSAFGAPSQADDANVAVPKGKVAITVDLPDPQRIAPLLKPGSHIVVYDTFNARDPQAKDLIPDGAHLTDDKEGVRVTRVLLADVEVIAVGQQQMKSKDTSASDEASDAASEAADGDQYTALVTVAVKPDDAMKLVHGVQTGTLYAGLKGQDAKVKTDTDVNDKTVLGTEEKS